MDIREKYLMEDYKGCINRVMDYISNHLDDDLPLKRLAQEAHFSVSHFHRVFQKVTGETYLLDPNPRAVESASLTFPGRAEALLYLTTSLDETQVNPADPQDWWSDVEWPVGLDDVYRISPGNFGVPLGMKGWWDSDETFVIHIDYIGNTQWSRMRFTFQGEQVTIEIRDEGEDDVTIINGRLEE